MHQIKENSNSKEKYSNFINNSKFKFIIDHQRKRRRILFKRNEIKRIGKKKKDEQRRKFSKRNILIN